MKGYLKPIFALAALALLATGNIQAETEEKMIIALKTNDFELMETDVSSLAVGESQTIETDSGKVIDILRTSDGVEIYVDGELLEMDFAESNLHEEHMQEMHVEVICDGDEECDHNVFILEGDDADISSFVTEEGENIVIHKEIELSCSTEEEGTECSDKMIWVSDGNDVDMENLHELHMKGDSKDHKVIMIKKHVVIED